MTPEEFKELQLILGQKIEVTFTNTEGEQQRKSGYFYGFQEGYPRGKDCSIPAAPPYIEVTYSIHNNVLNNPDNEVGYHSLSRVQGIKPLVEPSQPEDVVEEISDIMGRPDIVLSDEQLQRIHLRLDEIKRRQIHQAVVHTERRDYSPTPRDDTRQRINASIGASEPDNRYD